MIKPIALTTILVLACQASLSEPEDRKLNYSLYMSILVEEVKQNQPQLPFAAMIIDNHSGRILCKATNKGTPSPIDHAELEVIKICNDRFRGAIRWNRTTLISTAEPCPMCQGGASWANISTVVYGTSIPTLVANGWKQINLRAYTVAKQSTFNRTRIIGGVLQDQTDALFIRTKR